MRQGSKIAATRRTAADDAERKRRRHAEIERASAKRRNAGLGLYPSELDHGAISTLIAGGWLGEGMEADHKLVGKSTGEALREIGGWFDDRDFLAWLHRRRNF